MATVNVATKATATAAPTVSEGTSVKLGRKTYTVGDLIGQVKAEYETMYLLNTEMLQKYKYIGETLLSIRSLFTSDKLFGQFVAGTDLAIITRQDRSDCQYIAKNWAEIQKLEKAGNLDGLGVSAIRKRLTEAKKQAENPKNKAAAGNVSKGKTKAQAVKGTPAQETSVEALAAYVSATCDEKGWTVADFAKALSDLRKAK